MQALDTALADGAVLLVPNFPASTQLREGLITWRRSRGARAIQQTPAIEPIDLWLRKLWRLLGMTLDDARLGMSLLEPDQEILLWRGIISGSAFSAGLLNPEGTAREAREAWNLALQWRLPLDFVRRLRSDLADPEGSDFLGDWAWQFRQQCTQLGALSLSQMLVHLVDLCQEHPAEVRAQLPARLLLHGFSDSPPLYEALLSAMASLDCPVAPLAFTRCQPQQEQRVCQQASDELRAAARWAADLVREDPQARVGIICSNLQRLQPTLASVMRQEFSGTTPGTWQVLEQRRLDNEPFVHTALQLLDLFDPDMDTLELCSLLRSPWLQGADTESEARSKLEFHLRDRGEIRTAMVRFRELCAGQQEGLAAPILATALLQVNGTLLRLPRRQAFSGWLALMRTCWQQLLDADRLLRNGQQGIWQAWQTFLERLSQIDWLQPACSFPEAIAVLRCLAAARAIPAASSSVPVLVLSPLASAGLRFSHLWCLQCDERHWPAEPRPSAWLPWPLQLASRMPGTDPGSVLETAREQFRQLQENTRFQFVASWSQVEEDCQLRPSPLLAGLPVTHLPVLRVPAGLHPRLAELPLAACEHVSEPVTVPLNTDDPFGGDASLPAHQAACPFRAFALYRLGARPLETPRLGLPAAAFGSILHHMMELFWDGLGSSASLEAMKSVDLQEHIENCAARAVARTARHYPATLQPRFRMLEQQRLVGLLQQWLPQEQQRGPFTVLETEFRCQWRHRHLLLNIRIDRVDLDQTGQLVVVDYKSGKLPKPVWESERQDEPQLLLYVQGLEQSGQHAGPVAALLYARVHVEEPCYSGIGVSNTIYPGIDFSTEHKLAATAWRELTDHWQAATRALADEFLQGQARVQPLRRDTCTYCHLQGLCRIGARAMPVEDDSGGVDVA